MHNRTLWVSILSGMLAVLMVFTLFAGVLPGHAEATSLGALQAQKEELEKKKEEIDAKVSELESQLSSNLESMTDIVNQKNTIDQQIFMLYEQTANLNDQISTCSLLIADKQVELDDAEARLSQLNADNKERIRAMEENGHLSYWSVLFKANSFASLLDNLNMIQEIAAADRRRLKEISDTAAEVASAKETIEQERTALEANKVELAASQEQLEIKRAEADKLLTELIATGEEYEALLHDAEKDAASIGSDISDLEDAIKAEEDRIHSATAPPTPAPGASGSVQVGGLTWITPCNYVLLTSPYGWRTHPVYGDWRFHYGVDLAGPLGTPIYATRAGVVTTATYDSSAGYYVAIDHQDGFSSKYLHMTHYIVSAGEYVNAGQTIGYMGSTGTSTGSHLHFSILYNGSHVNPMDYIG